MTESAKEKIRDFMTPSGAEPLRYEHLAPGLTLYAQGHVWHPEPGETCRVHHAYFASPEEAKVALARTLALMGYSRPRWWQYWRWNERRLSSNILDRINVVAQ